MGLVAGASLVARHLVASPSPAGGRPGTVDVSVDGEWSFAQTLRHLVFATDAWLGSAILDATRANAS